MGMGGGVIQQAFAQAMNPGGYVNPSMFNAYSAQQPSPYQPAGSGYSTTPSGGGEMAGRYEIRKMAKGGIAAAAEHVANRGRGDDSVLVHMTPGEVQSLQKLAMAGGGSLTVNPATGLYEAGFLKNMLPMIAGIGLSMIPGVGPLAAAGMVGGFETVRTGDIGKGLMAGLGAYGGAGIGAGLTGAGASSIAEAGGQAAVDQLGSQASTLSADQLGNLSAEQLKGLQSVADSGMYNTADVLKTANAANTNIGAQNLLGANNFSNLNASQLQAYGDTLSSGAYNPADVIRSAGAQNATAGATGMQTLGAGFKAGPSAIYSAMPTGTLPATATSTLAAAMPRQEVPEIKEEPSSGQYISKDFRAYVPAQPNPYYRPQGLGYTGYAAQGGVMPDDLSYADGGMIDPMQKMPNGGLAALQGMRDGYGAPQTMDGNMPQMADGGSIGGYSDGGRMLKGPGDGMSDSIPGVIGNKQPARLADGEFVVPADVVSHLGNGSTDAGAKRLYGMMDKVRKARTGTKKQGKQIKPEKYMPA
jgi:hypothetical protein